MSVIVRANPGSAGAAARAVAAAGGRVGARLDVIDAVAARVPAGSLAAVAGSPGVAQVTPDTGIQLLGADYQPGGDIGSAFNVTQITGAQAMWAAGYTGKGVDVALIDSGVTPVAGLDGAGKLVNGPDLSVESQAPNLAYLDSFGHGTFMAGLIAGRDGGATAGAYPGDSADFLGMAPDAGILSVKVADSHGATDVSQVIAAIAWVIQHRLDNGLNVRVLNLSFGTDSTQPYVLDPLAFAAEKAWQSGIVVVASAGNAGWKTSGLLNPAFDPYLVAVGASDSNGTLATADDTVAAFSNHGDGTRNPDLVAPGRSVQSLRDPGSYIDDTYGATGALGARFFRGSGTSEATAVVSGAAALLVQQRPNATPDQIKAILASTATPLAGQPATAEGHGELNLGAARVAATPLTAQVFVPSTGLGSLEGARGTVHLVLNGTPLSGERDIFGAAVSTLGLANSLSRGTAWRGGSFNGNTWTGNTWTGNTWTGNTWTGNTWTGNTWTGNTWSGNTWTGNTWTGNTWTGNTWSSSSWG
ncbi:MAG TPA: S8 family serine peptidase [Candidatus Dormibacteraeota bacterium]|nr:S8 family serine peptidase [Candidatus Dormibacteraeota bacterium]